VSDKKIIRNAVLPVSDFGTRFLSATKAIPKELLPVVDEPLIQYVAEEETAAGIGTLIFVTVRKKRAIEDNFDSNIELESMLRANGKDAMADMVRNIIPEGVQCIFVRQAEQLGLGHAVLCAERAVSGDPFAVLLADNFLTDYEPGVTADLAQAFANSGKLQLSVVEVDGPDISNYGVVVPNLTGAGIAGLVEKPEATAAPPNLASIGRYVLTPDIFVTLRSLGAGSGGEIQLADAINIHAQEGAVETVCLNGLRFDCGSVDGFIRASSHEYHKRFVV
jgi:UTP--glucose-1-phosphate uridylyltransferase